MNCHGCKWLDESRKGPAGSGYCVMVENSDQGKCYRDWLLKHREEYALGRKELPSIKVRTPDMERCERYEAGDFATRYRKEQVCPKMRS